MAFKKPIQLNYAECQKLGVTKAKSGSMYDYDCNFFLLFQHHTDAKKSVKTCLDYHKFNKLRRSKYKTNFEGKYKETIKKITDPHPPLPAGGQAAAVLTERKRQGLAEIEKFKKSFGYQKYVPLTEADFNKRRQKMLKALQAT